MLGGFLVSVGSRTIEEREWRLRKAASLVKLLALEPGRQMHRERLMGLLWPDLDEKAAANNLRHALHVARKTLSPDPSNIARYLPLQGEQVALCPEGPLWVDVGTFEEAVATARRAQDPVAYRAAVDLYAEDLLPGDLYEGWAEERRLELRGTYLALLLELARLYEERGELEAAIEALDEAVAAEPTREDAHASLMQLHALSGRRRQALRQYERLSEALSGELALEPGAEVRRLREDISAGAFPPRCPAGPPEPAPAADTDRHNLPVYPSSFVGREREMVEIKRALVMTRLLTLTGAGGSGKTRLALAVVAELAGAYPDGVWLVELAPLSEGTLVPKAVAEVLRVSEQAERPVTETLVDAMRNKEALILLDNCEHVVDACASLVETLLDSCPRLRILATSREPLSIGGEANRLVPSLSLPDPERSPTVEDLAGYESARLFVERAVYKSSDFVLTPENAGAVAGICRQLDGIPLAIELAAARVGSLSVEQISERLKNSLKLLTGGSRTATPRQRTLRGALDWGYELLEEPEKRLFRRVSVFAGGWTLEAAEAVGAGEGIEEDDILDLISRLVEKSLVVAGATPGGDLRYRMLEPVRQYGRERLEAAAETAAGPDQMEAARRRHAAWYLALAEEAEPKLVGAEQAGWLDRLETEHDNLRAALEWFLATDPGEVEKGLRLAGALGEFWRVRGHLSEGLRWLETALVNGEEAPHARVKALVHAGWIAWVRADFGRSTAFSEEALALSRKLGDRAGAATALFNLGMVAIYDQMRAEEARALFEESLALRRELGDAAGASRALQRLGLISVVQQDSGRAAALYEESLMLARKAGDRVVGAMSLWLGTLAHLGLGDHQLARELAEEGFDLARQTGHAHITALILHVLAASAGSQGRPVRSARLWGAAETLRETVGVTLGPAERYHYGPYIDAARDQVDEAIWEAALDEGRAMTTERAVEYALSEKEPAAPTESPPNALHVELTRREKEVAALVARGLSSRQVASALTISERTVDNHVANILKKLDLHSRHEIRARLEEQQPRGAD
jgi:predicted ATPase/DNA-binding SARP family transcriptional activator/DNA-binding CsgD family transcriptional regulator